jgi:CheY-like chemotaxis protein
MEAMLRDSIDSQVNPTFSRMLTISEGIDFVKYLFNATGGVNFGRPTPNSVLVVDPDIEFVSSLERALANVNLRLVHAVDSMSAAILLERNSYQLMLVETDLPEMPGFNFCLRARAMSAHTKLPVMFLTNNLTTDSRARVLLCGGKEVFGKPVLASELIVKMLMQIMHDEIDAAKPA